MDDTELRLKKAMTTAKARYDLAKLETDLAQSHAEVLGMSHPDGRFALFRAQRAENHARQAYQQAVSEYSRFLLRRK